MSKADRKKKKEKAKQAKPNIRLVIPPNRRHKSKKDYKRVKVKVHEIDRD